MNSADPDYVLVESEANKVAKSAAKALKTSRRHCVQMGVGRGNVTWTGQHGSAGALGAPRCVCVCVKYSTLCVREIIICFGNVVFYIAVYGLYKPL